MIDCQLCFYVAVYFASFCLFMSICTWHGTAHSVCSLEHSPRARTHARTPEPRLDIRTSLVFQLAVVICQPELLGALMRPQPILSPDSSDWEQMDTQFNGWKKVMLTLHPASSFLQKLETILKALGLKRTRQRHRLLSTSECKTHPLG